MERAELSSPVWRIAAVTGEEPADVEAALASLVAAGMSHDYLWTFVRDALECGEKIVDAAARQLAEMED